jgi:plastocyanin
MRLTAWIGAALCAVATLAHAADVTGHVLLPRRSAARNAVVYLEGETRSAPLAHAVMDQRDKTFIPHVLPVTVGSTVYFPNNDSVLHNVFAEFEAARFDLGQYPHGVTLQRRMPKVGVVALLCNIHPDMSAYIVVVDTPYYATTGSDGSFKIPRVPPGTYTLKVWHESGAAFTDRITVTDHDAPMTLTLVRK